MNNKLTILGSGTCLSSYFKPLDYRHPAGHLLQYEGMNILLDCSEGMRGRLAQIKFDYFDLDAIFITHLHPDHYAIEPLMQALGIRALYEKTKKTLGVYGPKDIEKIFIREWNEKHGAGDFENRFSKNFLLVFHEYKNENKIILAKNSACIPYQVIHGVMDAYTLRFELGNKVITYSGDSGLCQNLQKAAEAADVFLCESSWPIDLKDYSLKEHINPPLAGEISEKSHVKKLILTHYRGDNTKEEMIKSIKGSGYIGEIFIANDFDTHHF